MGARTLAPVYSVCRLEGSVWPRALRWTFGVCVVECICPAACNPTGSWRLLVFLFTWPVSCPHPALSREAMQCLAARVGPPGLLPIIPNEVAKAKTVRTREQRKKDGFGSPLVVEHQGYPRHPWVFPLTMGAYAFLHSDLGLPSLPLRRETVAGLPSVAAAPSASVRRRPVYLAAQVVARRCMSRQELLAFGGLHRCWRSTWSTIPSPPRQTRLPRPWPHGDTPSRWSLPHSQPCSLPTRRQPRSHRRPGG